MGQQSNVDSSEPQNYLKYSDVSDGLISHQLLYLAREQRKIITGIELSVYGISYSLPLEDEREEAATAKKDDTTDWWWWNEPIFSDFDPNLILLNRNQTKLDSTKKVSLTCLKPVSIILP